MNQPLRTEQPPADAPAVPPIWRKALDNPWLMLLMLFFVTAALGIPFLWISRGFSRTSKIVLTVLVSAWTVLIFWLFWLVIVWSWTRVSHALGWS
jgi:hypothetical protein